MKKLTFSICSHKHSQCESHMNRVIFGKNRCGVEMNYDRLVVEKFLFVKMV